MFRVKNKDDTTNNVFIQGARSTDSINDIAGLVFQNYDFDDNTTHDMAAITLKDHYGTVNSNGFGDLVFKTSASNNLFEHMRITYSGNVGIGVPSPQYKLHCANTARFTTMIVDDLLVTNLTATNISSNAEFGNSASSGDYNGFISLSKVTASTNTFITVASISTKFVSGNSKEICFTSHLEPDGSSNAYYNVRVLDVTDRIVRGSFTYSNPTPKKQIETITWTNDEIIHQLEFQVKKNAGAWISVTSLGLS